MPRAWVWLALIGVAVLYLARRPLTRAAQVVVGKFQHPRRGEILVVKLAGPVGIA
jgi:hypothetical protein